MSFVGILNKELSKTELLALVEKQEQTIYALQHNDRKYENLFNNSLDGIYRSTPDGKFINVNSALVKMLGYNSKEELLKVNIRKELYVDDNDRKEVVDHFSDTEKFRHRLYKKDGSIIWVENHGENITNSNGELLYYEGIVRDVTEIKKASDIQKVLLNISQNGYQQEDLKAYNKFIISELGKLIDVSNSYIAYYNKGKETISIPFISGEEADEEFPITKTLTGYVIKTKKPLLVGAEKFKELEDAGEIELVGAACEIWAGVPLIVNNEAIGAIVVQSYDDANAYSQKDIELLEFVSTYISSAIEKNKQMLELKKFSLAVEQSSNTIAITDIKGNIEYVNSKFIESTGYSKEEAIGVNPRILNSGTQPKEYYAEMWKTISSGKVWKGEFQNKSKSGKLYWERVAITPIKNRDGVVTNYMAIKEDVTLQKATDKKLRKVTNEATLAKEVLRKVLDNIPIRIFWKDIESRFLGCNKAYLTEMGFDSEEEVIGKTDFDIHLKKDAERFRASELEIVQTAQPKIKYQEVINHPDKKQFVLTSKLPFFNDNNEVIGVLGASEDITERLENEEKLKKATNEAISANLSKSIFLSNMSHEIRTPLNAILGYSQLLQDGDNLTKVQYENLETINRSGEHLLALINDILDMSKIEAGRITLKETDFNFAVMLKEVEGLFKHKAAQKNIELTTISKNYIPGNILADESKIRQVIINLIGNALKFTSKGFVKITVEVLKDNFINVTVKDSGVGILKEEQEAVFKPFEQAQKGARVSGGTGLGLAISKKFANLMDGDITIESELGKGSEFSFTFGFKASEQAENVEGAEELKVVSLVPEMKGLKLAIVDDRLENRDILLQKFTPLGFDIKQAENGLEAVELYKNWKPEIILMDVVMPVLNGIEATRQILQMRGNHDVKIFIVSASALESEQQEVMDIGATVFIKKPVNFVDLLAQMVDKGGVKFVYEVKKKIEINYGLASEIPQHLKDKFIEASEEGDFELLQNLLEELENDSNKSFKEIEECINEMEFEKLINWLKT
ncbi:PAS domain S-box protein [Lutibacter sp. HS1-25]|uniref:PAS domain S-box protein n=1 Tax=Lutibacter sp. HS1-25 TaxID=2485000 RepID=UPI0010110772|nr:PAS domain S-box protein [Lutibacter sp. HS1-25]RXP58555.1 PAS domain S-box protein [Lutibacter sp. HS1-25]